MQELTTILQNLGAKQEVTAPTAEPPALNLQEETPTGGEALVPDTAKETSDTSFSKLKKKPSGLICHAVKKQDVPSEHRQTASIMNRCKTIFVTFY